MTITIAIAYSLGAAGGAALILRPAWGPYLAAAACLTLIVRTVLTAWMLMFERPHALHAVSAQVQQGEDQSRG
jgi:hypothetical protein